jgi:formate dehydrogenase subunit gamma
MAREMQRADVVERYSRPARWFHALVYITVLTLLGTGWWLVTGREGHPSVLAAVTGVPDVTLHTYAGWALTGLAVVVVTVGGRTVRAFLAESVRVDRGDARWLRRWPVAALTGRFARHDGRFDPGQRVANLVVVVLLLLLIGTGVGLLTISGGPAFVWLQRVHRWSTYLLTPVLLGHVVIASGVLPGYRGVARSMHFGGRLRVEVARRIWPAWLARNSRR